MGSNDYALGIEEEDLGERREEVENDSVRSEDDSSAAMDDFLRSRINNLLVDDGSASFSQEMGQPDFPEDKVRMQLESSIIREPPQPNNKLTEPRTPVREDSSSSSSSSFAHSQLTPLYNPFSNYTPTRPLRKQVMGMSIMNDPTTVPRPYGPLLETDEALEDYAKQMRTELRYAEMLDMATEAERAADAGEEKFVARPSTYGESPPQGGLRRRRSFSEGSKTNLPVRRNQKSKLGVLALRDVQEVFPNFAQFHSHLRTHLARNKVQESTLVFREETTRRHQKGNSLDFGMDLSSSSRHGDFFRKLQIHNWVGKSGFDAINIDCKAFDKNHSGVGELVAGHLHEPNTTRPRIDVPPGLDLPPSQPKLKVPRYHSGSSQTDETEPISSSSDEDSKPHWKPMLPLSPRALFDDENDSAADSVNDEAQFSSESLPATPVDIHRASKRESGPDFMTPARLRDMRRENHQEQAGLLLPSNSVLETPSSQRTLPRSREKTLPQSLEQPLLGVREALRKSERRDSSILIPVHVSHRSGINGVIPQKENDSDLSYDSKYDVVILAPKSTENGAKEHSDELDSNSPESSPKDPSDLSPDKEAFGFEEKDNNNSRHGSRKVKVSVYAGSPSDSRKGMGQRTQVLQQSHLLRGDAELPAKAPDSPAKKGTERPIIEITDLIQTPQQDCGCLSLSPDRSVDSTESMSKATEIAPPIPLDVPGPDGWDMFGAKGAKPQMKRRSRRFLRKSSFGNPFNMFPKNMFPSKKRLYIRKRENDDFMNNYLYCSKPIDDENIEKDGHAESFSDPCNGKLGCEDMFPGFCCAAMLCGDATLEFGPRRMASSVSLGGPGANSKTEAESWFDMATEGIDSVLEQLARTDHKRNEECQWNVTFQAPSLKKCLANDTRQATDDMETTALEAIVENRSGDSVEPPSRRKGKHWRHITYPLTTRDQGMISDEQFQLFYGIPRVKVPIPSTFHWEDPSSSELKMSLTMEETKSKADSFMRGPSPTNEVLLSATF